MQQADDYLLQEQHVAVKQCRYGWMAYNIHDTIIGRSLERYGEWTEEEIDLLTSLVSAGDLVIDVGANIGTHTVPLARAVTESGEVIAIEPQRLVFQNLCTNLCMNAIGNVMTFQAVAGDQPGVMRIPVINPTREVNFGGVTADGHDVGEPVMVLMLDQLGLARCRLIKIDVEGFEMKVLKGAQQTIARCRPLLFVENNKNEGSRELIELLQQLGYDCWWHLSNYFNPANFRGCTENIFDGIQPEANLLCVHKETEAPSLVKKLPRVEGCDDTWEKVYNRMR